MTFYNVDSLGDPVGPSFFSFPGENITDALLPGGQFHASIDYSNKTWKGFTGVFVASAQLLKSSLEIAVNPVTGEQVTVGNDWTMGLVSSRLSEIVRNIPYPTFAGLLDIRGGCLVATSLANLSLVGVDQISILPLVDVNNTFARDLSVYLADSYPASSVQKQLERLVNKLENRSNSPQLYIGRIIDGTRWMLELKLMNLLGEQFIFAVYMNVDHVEKNVVVSGVRTGYMMLGIILGFLLLGAMFSWTVARQLTLVSKQIALLKALKFHEVLNQNSGIKIRSFIYELAGLQQAFQEMAQKFAQTLQLQASMHNRTTSEAAQRISNV
ncbi:UNVERIFIED_CONTAM: hypothetical protein HDU68_012256 [Siphonaria sp. JEL0065]|nr:hypothetical protein HDU68_012256 [Siphonaria sp. JEL0065]